MLRIWTEQLRTLVEELEQFEELAVRALKILVVRALRVKHLAYE